MTAGAAPALTAPDGLALGLHDLGGAGTEALYVHAASLHGRVWGPVARANGDVLRSWGVDLRGHGDSGWAQPPADWTPFAADVASAAAMLGRPLVGVGHSLGGAAILTAELAAPGTFRELVLFEPAVSDPARIADEVQQLYAGVARRRRRGFAGRAEAMAHYRAKPPTAAFDEDVLHAYVEHGFRPEGDGGAVALKCPPEREATIYEARGPHRLWEQLDTLSCPVTLVRGSGSTVWHERDIDDVAARLGARTELLSGVGHFGPLEDPGGFAAIVRAALDRA